MNGETANNPIHMKIVGTEPNVSKLVLVAALSLAPVAVAILMQNPSLRQAIQMRAWFTLRKVSHTGAQWWRKMEVVADHHYDLARL